MKITTREDAIRRGESRYFTGKSCKNGHIAERRVVNYNCVECQKLHSSNHYKKDKPKHRKRNRKWIQDNPKRNTENSLKFYNGLAPEERRKRSREQYKRTPDTFKRAAHKRRATKMKSGGSYTAEEWKSLVGSYGGKCLRCGSTENITVDHVIPISRGGKNTIDNLQPLCRHCNAVKGTKTHDYRPPK